MSLAVKKQSPKAATPNKAAQNVKMALKEEKDPESNEESDEAMNEEFEDDSDAQGEEEEDMDDEDDDAEEAEEDALDEDQEDGETEESASKDADEKVAEVKTTTGENVKKGEDFSLFIGNLPTTIKENELKTMFGKYGQIVSVRFRSNTGAKIQYKKALKQVPFLNAYVRFSSKEEMEKACEMDGQTVEQNHIRVCPANKKKIGDPRSTVFVGNLPRGISENELYDFFDRVGPIEFVRVVGSTNVAFVCYKKGVAIVKALKLNGEMLKGRPVRVQKVDVSRTNVVKTNKKGHVVPANRLPGAPGGKSPNPKGAKNGGGAGNAFHGKAAQKGQQKKRVSMKKGKDSAKGKRIIARKLSAAATNTKQAK